MIYKQGQLLTAGDITSEKRLNNFQELIDTSGFDKFFADWIALSKAQASHINFTQQLNRAGSTQVSSVYTLLDMRLDYNAFIDLAHSFTKQNKTQTANHKKIGVTYDNSNNQSIIKFIEDWATHLNTVLGRRLFEEIKLTDYK